MWKFIILLAMVLFSSACAHKFTSETVALAIIKGKTTQAEILAMYGAPDNKYKTPGMKIVSGGREHVLHSPFEVWLYYPHQSKLINMLEPETLRIIFNTNGIVTNYDYHDDGD